MKRTKLSQGKLIGNLSTVTLGISSSNSAVVLQCFIVLVIKFRCRFQSRNLVSTIRDNLFIDIIKKIRDILTEIKS